MRVAIYCRVDGGGSLEMRRAALDMQRCELEHYAVEKGFQISGYYEDNGFSGHDLSRPGLTQLRISLFSWFISMYGCLRFRRIDSAYPRSPHEAMKALLYAAGPSYKMLSAKQRNGFWS